MSVISKTPGERRIVSVSVADELNGQTVVGVSATMVAMGLAVGPALTYVPSSTATGAALDISAGTDGEIYRIDVAITLDDEQILERAVEVHLLDLTFAVPRDGSPTSYISPTAYMARFGIDELILLTSDPHTEPKAVNKDRFFAALQDASAWMDSILAGRYVVPISSPPNVLVAHSAAITREYLYHYADGTPEHIQEAAKAARAAVRGLANADLDLPGMELRPTTVETPSWTPGSSQFSDTDLEGF